MHDLKLTPTEGGTKTGTNTSIGVWCGDILRSVILDRLVIPTTYRPKGQVDGRGGENTLPNWY